EFKQISKSVYYYQAQVQEYKDILTDPKRLEQKAIQLLSQMPVYQQFMRENSRLASMFRLPGLNNGSSIDPNAMANALQGLQTRAMIQDQLGRTISAGGHNASQVVQQNVQAANAQLNELKNKINA